MAYTPNLQPVGQENPQEEPLVLDDTTSPGDITPETVDARAGKFKYGLGDLLQKTKDDLYQDIQNGKEGELRAAAAATIDERKQTALQDLLVKTAANKQGPLTDEEKLGLTQIVQDMSATTDPATVMETAYGKQFMAQLDRVAQGNPDNVYTDAMRINPDPLARIASDHSVLIGKNQIIDTMIENQKDKLKSQGYVGYGFDIAKGFVPGYEDYNLRGLTSDVTAFQKYGLGANLEETRRALMRLPADEMQRKLQGIVNDLESGILGGNPQLALTFLESMKGMSSNDIFIKNWSGPVDIAGTVVGSKTAKGLLKATASIFRDAETAIHDVSRAGAVGDASQSTVQAAAGDLQESAITRATAQTVADAHNVPDATRRAVEALSSTHRADEAAARANPGQFGQDLVNRIFERGNSMFANLLETATNIQKNERLPEVLSNETAVRAIVEDMKGKYTDLKNSIIDTSPIYREPLSNTYLIDLHIGTNDGTYFNQRSVAENYIKYHRLQEAEIVEGDKTAFTKSVVQENKYTQNIKDAQAIIERERGRMAKDGATDAQKAKSAEQISTAEEYIVDQAQARHELLSQRRQTATVDQQGLGYFIRITKPIDETAPAIRDAIALTGNTKIPDSAVSRFFNSWIGKYRTPEDVLSVSERQNRLTTTYAPSIYFQLMVDNAKDIRALQAGRFQRGHKRWKEWQRGLENAQELPDPSDTTGLRKGYFFQSPGEMETYWQQWFHRLPDEQEVGAYFEFKRGMEMDRVLRNIAEHRNAQRLGNETHSVILRDASGKEFKSPEFTGKQLDHLPGASDNIAVFTENVGKESIADLSKKTTEWKDQLRKDIARGYYKLIEIYNPALRPLKGFSGINDERIRYVAVPNVETRALDWNHIPRRGGGHVQYDYDYYIKQAKIRPDAVSGAHWYEGDTTVMAVPLEAVGKRVAEHLNNIRKYIKEGNEEAARAYSNQHMHVNWDEVSSWFKGRMENGTFTPPRLSLNEDLHVVPRNRKVIDHDNNLRFKYTDFRDETKEGSMAAQNQVEFNKERDAYDLLSVDAEGTRANPVYKVNPADKIDPITTMNRGLARISRSNFMDDYKTMAVEHWLAQAKNYLNVKTPGMLAHSPFYHFAQGEFLPSTPANLKAHLEATRYHIQQFTGQPSDTDALLMQTAQKLADLSFKAFGPKGLVVTPTWTLPFLRDPLKYARGAAFHMKLGMFNIPQFIVQAGNYANIMGIAGHKYATPGTLAAQLHFWSTVNSHPSILDHLDSIANKMMVPGASRWKIGEFKEALQEGQLSGFFNVGGEYAALDDMTAKVVSQGYQTFLDWGDSFFKAGERNARYGAWYTAFKEYRDANPLGRITNADRAKILQRADLLNINMSRASSSAIHKGIFSIPTQFYTYQIRLSELMFGGRLKPQEIGRLLLTNAALFGVPMSAGMTSLPIADYIRQSFLERGYVVGDSYLQSMLVEGVPSAIGAFMTGKGDPQAGTWYDVGPRFGTKGLEFLGRATGGVDKGWLDIAGGPVYSIAKNTWQLSDGLVYAMGSLLRRDGEVFPMVPEDMADVFREITSFNAAWRIYAATQYGRWVSRKDAYLADTTTGQAVFGAIAGVKDTNIDDIQLMLKSVKEQSAYEKEVQDRFQQEFRRGVLAQNDNPELAKRFFTRAQAWLDISGLREDRMSAILAKALNDNQSILDKTRWDFYIRKPIGGSENTMYNAMQRTQRIDDKKRGE